MRQIMTGNERLKRTLDVLRRGRNVLVCAHRAPDGDTLGSALALASLLRRMGAQTTLVCHDSVPPTLDCLPGREQFVLPSEVTATDFDLAVAVDSSDLERLGDAGELFLNAPLNLQIDHHPTNVRFGQHNLVIDDVPATACIMYRLFEEADVAFSQDEAICLYAGISTDTGSFCFGTLTAETFEQMAGLMRAELPIAQSARQLHLTKQKSDVLLLGRSLSSLRFYADDRVTGMTLRKEDFEAASPGRDSADGIVNYGLYIPGVRMCYLASETAEGIKVSLRALPPYDVSAIAASFGGGGHVLAAGCTIQASLEQAEHMVRSALVEALS